MCFVMCLCAVFRDVVCDVNRDVVCDVIYGDVIRDVIQKRWCDS